MEGGDAWGQIMTRLRSEDIQDIAPQLARFDAGLRKATGLTLKGLACRAASLGAAAPTRTANETTVICISMTGGLGEIGGFCETLAEICRHLGFKARVSKKSDAAGFFEAYQMGADIIFTADDNCYMAVNTRTRKVVHNNEATGCGFAAALDRMAGGLTGEPALVIGCGPVGQSAGRKLMELGAEVCLFDIDPRKSERLAQLIAAESSVNIQVENSLGHALQRHRFILDATPAGDIIDAGVITPETRIAAPGVPCGVTPRGRRMLKERLVYDTLAIGTATMLMAALKCE